MNHVRKSGFCGHLIFHDYNGNPEITQRLLRLEQTHGVIVYFSYGRKLYDVQTRGYKSLALVPLERIFLETDDCQERTIWDVYEKASEVLKIGHKELRETLWDNFQHCFPNLPSSLLKKG